MNTRFPTAFGSTAPQSQGLQLSVPTVSHENLASFEDSEEAKHLQRLEADRDLYVRLALLRFEGPEWDDFACVLAEYGYQVVCAWIRSEKIFDECARRGLGLPRGFVVDDDAEEELANETVACAIDSFRRKVLIGKKWDPSKEATLKTFFVGQCVYQFPNTYRKWIGEQDLPPADLDRDALRSNLDAMTTSRKLQPDQMVDLIRTIASLKANDPRAIKYLSAVDFTQAEIAEILRTTERAISSKIYRAQRPTRRRGRP